MTLTLAAVVLFAAFLNACWNALVKVSGDRLAVVGAISLLGGLYAAALIPFAGMPDPASWPLLGAAILVHVAYIFLVALAYNHGDLGQVYPIARGCSPLLVTVGAAIFAGEFLAPVPLFGVLLLTVGVMALAFDKGRGLSMNRKAVALALLTGISVAAYTVVDGLGARQAGSAIAFSLWLKLGDGLLAFFLVLPWKGRAMLEVMRKSAPSIALFSMVNVFSYGVLIWALAQASLAVVSALRETSVLFAALIATFWLKEPFGAWRFASAVLVVVGIALTRY